MSIVTKKFVLDVSNATEDTTITVAHPNDTISSTTLYEVSAAFSGFGWTINSGHYVTTTTGDDIIPDAG